jgi:hypothetical protein
MIIQIISGFIKNHFFNMLNLIQRILKFYSKLYTDSTDLMTTLRLWKYQQSTRRENLVIQKKDIFIIYLK